MLLFSRIASLLLALGGCALVSTSILRAGTGDATGASAPTQTTPSPATPEIAPPAGNTPPGPDDFWTESYLTGNWGGLRDQLQKDGVTFTPVWTGEVFGNPSGGARRGLISDGLFNLPLDFNLDPLTGGTLKDTTFHVNAFYIYGANLSSHFVGDFSTTSNIAAYNSLRLDELWLQKKFWDGRLSLKIGNLAADTEFFQSASSGLFISATFGSFTLIANNVANAPFYPLASPGVRLQLAPDPHYYAMAGVYGLDDHSNPAVNNQNGTRFSLDSGSGILVLCETGYLLNQGPNDKGLQGSYRLGSWIDTGNFTTFTSQADSANGTGPLRSAGADFGIYGIVDQQIYSQGPRNITIFTRCGGAPTNTNFVDFYVDGGFNFTGFIPGRDNDIAGLAIARSHVSQDFSAAQVAQGSPPSSAETVLEATYKLQLSPWWNVQPDFQYIITPSGVAGSHNATVLGLRTSVAF